MCTRNQLDAILNELVDAYHNVYGDAIVRVLLYGSYARGDFDNTSDIDVVAIVKGERGKLQEGLHHVWDVSSELDLEYGTIVSPTVIPYDEYERYKASLPYYMNIEKEGVEVA